MSGLFFFFFPVPLWCFHIWGYWASLIVTLRLRACHIHTAAPPLKCEWHHVDPRGLASCGRSPFPGLVLECSTLRWRPPGRLSRPLSNSRQPRDLRSNSLSFQTHFVVAHLLVHAALWCHQGKRWFKTTPSSWLLAPPFSRPPSFGLLLNALKVQQSMQCLCLVRWSPRWKNKDLTMARTRHLSHTTQQFFFLYIPCSEGPFVIPDSFALTAFWMNCAQVWLHLDWTAVIRFCSTIDFSPFAPSVKHSHFNLASSHTHCVSTQRCDLLLALLSYYYICFDFFFCIVNILGNSVNASKRRPPAKHFRSVS